MLVASIGVFGQGGASAFAAAGPAGTAELRALQAQAAAEGAAVRRATVAYDQALVAASAEAAQLSADREAAARAASRVAATSAALRREAILAYVGAYSQPLPAAATGATVSDPAVRAAYVDLSSGMVAADLTALREERLSYSRAEADAAAALRSDQAALASAARAGRAALARAGAVQAQLVSLQARIDAAQAAAEPKAPLQGGPVNGGLVAVVRSQLAPLPVAAASARPARPAAPTTVPPTTVPPTTVPPTTLPPTTVPPTTTGGTAAATPPSSSAPSPGVWLQLRECESGDDYQANTGNGYYGAYQFSQQTWTDLGLPGRPDLEPPAMQDQAAEELQARYGWGQWPACAAALGLT
ncbi:MAG TPA: transglycosylase family protein [Acidimicrobiales bacterium]|nr:transglycosylase family protein [Acidimicrobiales bacterium]